MMLRLPLRMLPSLIIICIIIGWVTSQVHWLLGLALFVVLVLAPAVFFYVVHYRGASLAIQGNLKAAVDHYTRLLELPFLNRFMLYTRRAALRNGLGDLDGAIADYSEALQYAQSKDNAMLYAIRSALYLGKRDFVNALADSEQLLKLQPASEVGYANRAAAKMFLGDIDGAIADCDTGLSKQLSGSGKALLYNNRGTAYRMIGNYNEAMMNYNLAMGTSLSDQEKRMIHPSIITNQGILYHLQKEYESAKAYFHQATGVNPSFYKSLVGLAAARFRLGQIREAQKLWTDLLQKEPRYQDSLFLQNDLNLPLEMVRDMQELKASIS